MTEQVTPLTPPDSDLRDFQFMPVDVVRLRDSGIAVEATGDEFRAALLLWCASWHQVPAGSLPDNNVQLSMLAGYGRVVKEWLKVREGAMRGFIVCSDGRLYHPVVAEKVNEAWRQKCVYAEKREADRVRKEAVRLAEKERLSAGHNGNVQRMSAGQTPEITHKGQGEDLKGQGECKEKEARARFDRFWERFPTSPNDPQLPAFEQWLGLDLSETEAGLAIAGASAYADWLRLPEQKNCPTCHAHRWLRERRWEGFATGRLGKIDPDLERVNEIEALARARRLDERRVEGNG